MTKKPEISIFGSARRPHNWMTLYESIGDNDVAFEIVFVGPNHPDYELPKNFKFIRSLTKPTQCFEIAVRNTSADLIMNIADDTEFRTSQPLDKLYNTYRSFDNDKLILSCRYMLNNVDISGMAHRFFADDTRSPIMPVCGLMSKRLFNEIGGVDRNFIAVMWDLDVAMRVLALGGNVILSDVYIDEIKPNTAIKTLCAEFWNHDRKLLEDLWSKNGIVHFNRTKPVDSFADYEILERSQGPRGRWRGGSPIMLEKIVDYGKKVLHLS